MNGNTYRPATQPPYSLPSAMFSLAWPKDRAPASIGSPQVQAFTAALKAFLPGAMIHVVRHVSESTCTSKCGGYRAARRSTLAAVVASHFSGSCSGRVVFNVVVAAPNRVKLEQLVWLANNRPGSVWSPGKVSWVPGQSVCQRQHAPWPAHTHRKWQSCTADLLQPPDSPDLPCLPYTVWQAGV